MLGTTGLVVVAAVVSSRTRQINLKGGDSDSLDSGKLLGLGLGLGLG